jgi:Icc-related predicted phosphoesterase
MLALFTTARIVLSVLLVVFSVLTFVYRKWRSWSVSVVIVLLVLHVLLAAAEYLLSSSRVSPAKRIETKHQYARLQTVKLKTLPKGKSVRIVVTSDTHCEHGDIQQVPDGDVLIHCGDFTKFLPSSQDIAKDPQIQGFVEWLKQLPHKNKIICCGNHEIGLGKLSKEQIAALFPSDCYYLQDSGVSVEGINFYGSPWTSNSMAFHINSRERHAKWNLIPKKGIDVLITHIPPFGINDQVEQSAVWSKFAQTGKKEIVHEGCKELRKWVDLNKPPVHCFGHVHNGWGASTNGRTLFINASWVLGKTVFAFDVKSH